MTIAIVNVPVPLSGEGASADISALTGEKTVVLSGTFEGRYVLLGSHDDINFVPVLIFDANGEESIKKTLPEALRSVKVRVGAINASNVTLNVSGTSVPGENLFTPSVTFLPGMSGPQPAIDLFAVFPPTGLERYINGICRGRFSGSLVCEGSLDAIHFNPCGSFRADPQPASLLGGQPVLEFSPLQICAQIRYLRPVIDGIILAPTTLSLGGNTPSASPGPGSGALIELSDDEGKVASGLTEVILYEWAVNLTDLTVGANITVQLNSIIQALGRGNAAFRVYVGATTPGNTTGGTVRASTATASASEITDTVTGAAFANPGGPCLVQITGYGDDASTESNIRGVSVVIG